MKLKIGFCQNTSVDFWRIIEISPPTDTIRSQLNELGGGVSEKFETYSNSDSEYA